MKHITSCRRHTLASIAEERHVQKRAVQNWLAKAREAQGQEIGEIIDGVRYFSDKEKKLLLSFAVDRRSHRTTTSQAIAPEVMPEGFIQCGPLAPVEERQLQLPRGFDPTAMIKFFDGVAGQATDTATLVRIADMALNSVEGAMNQKIREQRQQLSRSEQDAKTLAGRMNEAKTRLQVKALESKLLAERQTDATVSAEALFAELMAMGKPQEANDDTATDGSISP